MSPVRGCVCPRADLWEIWGPFSRERRPAGHRLISSVLSVELQEVSFTLYLWTDTTVVREREDTSVMITAVRLTWDITWQDSCVCQEDSDFNWAKPVSDDMTRASSHQNTYCSVERKTSAEIMKRSHNKRRQTRPFKFMFKQHKCFTCSLGPFHKGIYDGKTVFTRNLNVFLGDLTGTISSSSPHIFYISQCHYWDVYVVYFITFI